MAEDLKGPAYHANLEKLGSFTYEPLEAGQIRILELDPLPANAWPRGNWVPSCKLKHVDLSQRPLYTAVSYVWGSSVTEHYGVTINERAAKVRINVVAMLRWLSRPRQSRSLWIDAICINQDDIKERNAQVRLMGDIFAKANYVLSWLDHSAGFLTETLLTISRISRRTPDYEKHDAKTLALLAQRFFQHQYWKRRWVIQEVALGRSVILTTPSNAKPGQLDQLPLSMLLGFYSYIDNLLHTDLGDLDQIHRCLAKNLLEFRTQSDPLQNNLRDLLIIYSDTLCADVRDKVFALAALSPIAKSHLNIDYGTNTADLLLSVVHLAFEHEQLSSSTLIGLFLELKNQMEVTKESLSHGFQKSAWAESLDRDRIVLITMMLRGTVNSNRLEPNGEAYAYRLRDITPSLRTLEPKGSSGPLLTETAMAVQRWRFPKHILLHTCEYISGQDLYMFTFNQGSEVDHNDNLIVGVSTTRVEIGDEIWQFRDTPVALIARRQGADFIVCGRAFLLKPSEGETYTTDYQMERPWPELVDFARGDGKLYQLPKRGLLATFDQLLDILDWIDFDR